MSCGVKETLATLCETLRASLRLSARLEKNCVAMQEADVVVSSIEKLGQILGVDAQVAQSLVTTDPRSQPGSSPT